MLTVLQASTTQTAPFTGSAIDVSALPPFGNLLVKVTALTANKEAQIQVQSSEDAFHSDIKIENQFNFVGPVGPQYPVTKEKHDYDMPGIRLGGIPVNGIIAQVAAPGTVTPTASTTGGTLPTGTVFYKVTALNANGETLASPEASVAVTGPTGKVTLNWTAVTGATSYRVYRGTSTGAESVYFTTATNSYIDTGTAGTAGTPPTSNTTQSANAQLRVVLSEIAASGSITYEAYVQS